MYINTDERISDVSGEDVKDEHVYSGRIKKLRCRRNAETTMHY